MEINIGDLLSNFLVAVYLIKEIVGYKGEFYFNTNKPDGTLVKLTDVSKLHKLGWRHRVELEEGIEKVYEWYKKHFNLK